MHLYSIQSYKGKNIHSLKPVIKMVVNIGELSNRETKEISGFNDRLLKYFPGLGEHFCALGYKGGFAQRLEEGTMIGHVTEHLILELQNLLGFNVAYGKTRIITEPSLYYIVYEYSNEKCGIECGKTGFEIITKLVKGEDIDYDLIINSLKKTALESDLGPSIKALYEEAVRRNIPVRRIGNGSLIQLGYGKYSRYLEASLSDATSCITADIAGDKHLTKQLLSDNGIPVPYGDVAYTEEAAVRLAAEIGYPVAVKPLDGNQGKGVTLDISAENSIRIAYNEALKFSKAVIVEKFIKGKDYRILVVGDKVSAVSERRPPSVMGDGIRTIKELVGIENTNFNRGDDHERPLTKIKLDNVTLQLLAQKGMNEDYIPGKGETVELRSNGNISTGGTARECSSEIHPYNRLIAVKAAKTIGLDIAGVDMTISDISEPLNISSGAIIEVNAAPGLRMHIHPTDGEPRNVAGDIIDMLYPEGHPYSIPLISITGTNGKTTTTRLISHTISLMGKRVGMTSTSGVFIGSECVMKGDNTGPISARLVLGNREVEAAVLETARGGIVRSGLAYDFADVGVITNISEDHIGLDGLQNLQDLAFVKSLVIEAVKPEGYAVLNADDPMTDYLLKRVKCNIIFFSAEQDNEKVSAHISAGGKAVFLRDGIIYYYDGEKERAVLSIDEIPITYSGMVDCNIENSLAAISALLGINIPMDTIRSGLKSFFPDAKLNPGRFNIFDMGDFRVMLDYSHNIAGFNAVLKFMSKLEATRKVGLIGMPGDRLDKNIREVGGLCAKAFSKVYIKEDTDLRGRNPGEVAQLIYDAVLEGGMKKENIEIIHSELKALETAILDAQTGDLIVMFYEDFEPAFEMVNNLKKEIEQRNKRLEELAKEPLIQKIQK